MGKFLCVETVKSLYFRSFAILIVIAGQGQVSLLNLSTTLVISHTQQRM